MRCNSSYNETSPSETKSVLLAVFHLPVLNLLVIRCVARRNADDFGFCTTPATRSAKAREPPRQAGWRWCRYGAEQLSYRMRTLRAVAMESQPTDDESARDPATV